MDIDRKRVELGKPIKVAGAHTVAISLYREIKAEVTKKAEAQLAPGAVFGSNTSTLPITELAKGVDGTDAAGRFIGLHFFSPVDKMPLVEIIVGAQTSDETLARDRKSVV